MISARVSLFAALLCSASAVAQTPSPALLPGEGFDDRLARLDARLDELRATTTTDTPLRVGKGLLGSGAALFAASAVTVLGPFSPSLDSRVPAALISVGLAVISAVVGGLLVASAEHDLITVQDLERERAAVLTQRAALLRARLADDFRGPPPPPLDAMAAPAAPSTPPLVTIEPARKPLVHREPQVTP